MIWNPGQLVRHIDNPAKIGTVTDKTRPRTSGTQYGIKWDSGLAWHYEDELVTTDEISDDPLELIREGRYGRVDDLCQLLTHIHLTGRLSNVVYAMGLTQTDFYPHQYKPLLTLLDSPANGLLIADEVGLGKTIEAGLIWTELRARYDDMRRLLVVCPAMLREKWRFELSSRFGLDARVVDAATLLQELTSTDHRERAWVVSYQGIRVPSEWDVNESDKPKRSTRAKFADMLYQHADQDPLLDLIIFDEAHYMRNEQTGAWQTGSLLRDVSKHQLMLSATPINLGSNDLFNVLRLLDPDHFEYPEDFQNIVRANRPVIAASDVVRDPTSDADRIMAAVREIKLSEWFERSERVDRLIDEAESIDDWTNDKRIDIAAKLERLNLLAHIVCRTRKREVQSDRVLRDVTLFEAEMKPVERELYQAITEDTRAYALANGIEHGFLLSTPQRMVASSPAALLQTWHDDLDADAIATTMDEINEYEEKLAERTSGLKQWLASRTLHQFDTDDLRQNDSKFAEFSKSIKRFMNEDQDAKAIVFTTFRGTARYLVDRLLAENVKARLLMGGGEFDKDTVVSDFREDRKCRVLVCTDVAAEGVDLQFCRLIVNYDLPWNPMRIEQRIGRIDRLGQTSKRILIWSFVHKDTIDARIIAKLTDRIGVFETTLGETEEILGEVHKLEDVLLSRHLTADEEARLIEQAALAIEKTRQNQEKLEQEAIQLVAHGQQLLMQIEAARGNGKIITKNDLVHYVSGWIKNTPGCRFAAVHSEADTFDISLTPELAAELHEFLQRENLVGKTGLASGQARRCRFTDKITDKPKYGEEIVHRFHPIVRFLSRKIDNSENRFPLYAARVSIEGIDEGKYALAIQLASFSGVKEEEHLLVAAVSLDRDLSLDDRIAEALLDSVRKSGNDWSTVAVDIPADAGVAAAERNEKILRDRYKAIKGEKSRENKDRANVLFQLLDDHIQKKRKGFEVRIHNHEYAASLGNKRRIGLANAERKKMEDFLARMETRRATLERKSQAFSADARDIYVLFVDVVRPGECS